MIFKKKLHRRRPRVTGLASDNQANLKNKSSARQSLAPAIRRHCPPHRIALLAIASTLEDCKCIMSKTTPFIVISTDPSISTATAADAHRAARAGDAGRRRALRRPEDRRRCRRCMLGRGRHGAVAPGRRGRVDACKHRLVRPVARRSGVAPRQHRSRSLYSPRLHFRQRYRAFSQEEETAMGRLLAFLYGLAAYLVFFVTILYAIGFVTGLVVPKTIDTGTVVPVAEALIVNLLLMSLFAVQHSVMARKQFKEWWTQYVPTSVERSTYVLLASLALVLLFWQWRPMPAVVWQIADPHIALAIIGVSMSAGCWCLPQHVPDQPLRAVRPASGREQPGRPRMPALRFRTPVLYKVVRHPIYLGFIIAFWVAPAMTVGHMLFAAVTTAYIFVGIFLEERDLVELFGDEYRATASGCRCCVPWRKSAPADAALHTGHAGHKSA